MASRRARYLRASLAVLIGGLVGVVAFGGLTGWLLQAFGAPDAGFRRLLYVLIGAALGSFVGGYLRNRNDRLRTIPVASDVVVAVYDCTQACEHIEWSYSDLVAGAPLPYGTMKGPFVVTVEGGELVELSEVYLP